MRRHPFLKLFAVLVLLLGGLGLYRGWLTFSSHREVETKKVNVEMTVDPEKVVDDAAQVKDAAARVAKKAIGEKTDEGQNNESPERR